MNIKELHITEVQQTIEDFEDYDINQSINMHICMCLYTKRLLNIPNLKQPSSPLMVINHVLFTNMD